MPRLPVLPTLVVAVLALLASACSIGDTILPDAAGGVRDAGWAVDPEVQVAPEDTEVPLLVMEVDCASGQPADGRIRVKDIAYLDDRIEVVIGTVPRRGDQTCQGNPLTPYLLELDEPVGDRTLVNGSQDEIASRPVLEDVARPDEPDVAPVTFEARDPLGEEEFVLAEAFVARGRDREELGDLGDLRLADRVVLVLGTSGVRKEVAAEALADPDTWVLDDRDQGYQGFAGPFDVLEPLGRTDHVLLTIGDHPHCAGPSKAPPSDLAGFLRLGITPLDSESCIDWFSIDLYVDEDGRVRGVVLDLFGP